jgi:hypothetical protein
MDCDISARRQNEEVRCGTTAGGSSHTEAFIDLRSYPRDGEGNQVTDTSWGTREFGFRDLDGFDSGETFSGVDYGTALKSMEDIRKLVPTRISMAQFALRWILIVRRDFLCHSRRDSTLAGRYGCGEQHLQQPHSTSGSFALVVWGIADMQQLSAIFT